MINVLLKLRDGLGAEGVGNSFSFAGMFGPITGIEETALNGDKGIIVLAGRDFSWTLRRDMKGSKDIGRKVHRLSYLFVQPPVCEYTIGIASGSAMDT